jgi:NAD(P)H-dependent flavin oxidoreductase YrpB (nitropropane dioxygenase family)
MFALNAGYCEPVYNLRACCQEAGMTLAEDLRAKLRIPVMAGPMFIASTADLVIAQCKAGIIGSMPALNPRSTDALDEDIARIKESVGGAQNQLAA